MRRLWIEGLAGQLEATLRVACPARATAVVAHPHPLHGGTLHNPVVFHADRELHRSGFTTLRFNFRGVGTSAGEHDNGRGEVEDYDAAAIWLRGVAPDLPLFAVGFSFGSWCGLRYAVANPSVAAVIAIGIPIRNYPFDEVERLRRPLAVVQASEDEFGTPDEVRKVLERGRPQGVLRVIENTTHLFPKRAPEAGVAVADVAAEILYRLGAAPA